MSDHDPLCRRAQITEVFMEGCPECAFIAKVREDQSCKCKFWNGYAAALDRARDAVAALPAYYAIEECQGNPLEKGDPEDPDPWKQGHLIERDDALAAIDALQTSLSGPAAVRTSEPEPPTSVAPAGVNAINEEES